MDLLLWPVQETGSRVGRGVQPQRTRFLRRGASRFLPSSRGSQGAVAASVTYPSGRNHPTEKLAPNQQLLKQDGERREELGKELHPVAGPGVRPGRGSRFGVPGMLRDKRCGEPDGAWGRAPTKEGQPEQGARPRRQPASWPVRPRLHRPALDGVSARYADEEAGARTAPGEAYTGPASPRGVVGAPGRAPGQQESHRGQRLRPQAAGPSPERPAQDTAAATTPIPPGRRGPNQLEASPPYGGLRRRRRHLPPETDRYQAPHSAPGKDGGQAGRLGDEPELKWPQGQGRGRTPPGNRTGTRTTGPTPPAKRCQTSLAESGGRVLPRSSGRPLIGPARSLSASLLAADPACAPEVASAGPGCACALASGRPPGRPRAPRPLRGRSGAR